MFYDAMLASGVSEKTATLFYAAVYRFGPRWDRNRTACYFACSSEAELSVDIQPLFQEEEWKKLQARIEEGGFSVRDVEAEVDKMMSKDDTPIIGSYTIEDSDSGIPRKIELNAVGQLRHDEAHHFYLPGSVVTKRKLPAGVSIHKFHDYPDIK